VTPPCRQAARKKATLRFTCGPISAHSCLSFSPNKARSIKGNNTKSRKKHVVVAMRSGARAGNVPRSSDCAALAKSRETKANAKIVAKLVLSALLRPRREGVQAEVAEFPEIKLFSWSLGAALARLREAVWQRMQWTEVETSCAGEPISPVPKKTTSNDLAVPIEMETPATSPTVK